MVVLAVANTMLATAKAAMNKCVHRDRDESVPAARLRYVLPFKMKEV